MAKQSKKVATPKGKQAPNTEKKTTKKVAPKVAVKEVKVVEKVVEPIVVEPTAEIIPIVEITPEIQEVIAEAFKEEGEIVITPQTPLTEAELEEKALEAHYASLGQIDFYIKNIKK